MTFLAPGFLFAALGVAGMVVAVHFIVTRQPRAGILPTARFVPDLPATATARATRPSDLLLMLLRVLIVLAAGTALAGPVITAPRVANARVILVDVSRSSRDRSGLRDSALSVYRDGDAVVLFDSSARQLRGSVRDSLASIIPSTGKGNLSGALIAAMRAGSWLRERADSLQLVIVSPLSAEEVDAATDSIRMLWSGNARLVRVASADTTPRPIGELALRASAADPLHVAVSLARRMSTSGSVVVRGRLSVADSLLAVTGGTAMVEWPVADRPRGAVSRSDPDMIGGVVADGTPVISAFVRRWRFTSDSLRGAEIIARWIDGEPAAVEWPAGMGCVRSVAVPVPSVGDLVIRDDFIRFVAGISERCSGDAVAPMSGRSVASLTGDGGMAPRDAFRTRDDVRSALAPWLLAIAIFAALAELYVRRGPRLPGGARVASSPLAGSLTP